MGQVKRYLSVAGAMLLAGTAAAQQASLNLQACQTTLCHTSANTWEFSKAVTGGSPADGIVMWTITATKTVVGGDTITANGAMTINNFGAVPATVGNIVVNLQKRLNNQWVTASSDIANATLGDGAAQGRICPTASSESLSIFNENAASSTLEFMNSQSNTIFSLVNPSDRNIPAGGTVPLIYSAKFNNGVLNLANGADVRIEFIVTFGNAGNRGNSGASCNNVDIDGSGSVDNGPEKFVRSVPCRVSMTLPLAEPCGASVYLTDTGPTTTGTASYAVFQTYDSNGDDVTLNNFKVSNSATFTAMAGGVQGGSEGGTICNAATLTSSDSACCPVVNIPSSACESVEAQTSFSLCSFSSYSQGGFQGSGAPGQILLNNWAACFPNGVTIGINDGSGPLHHAIWVQTGPTITGVTQLRTRLGNGGGGSGSALTADLTNPTNTAGGNLARQTAALALNVGFNDCNKLHCSSPDCNGPNTTSYGDLIYCNSGNPSDSLSGSTVRQVLAAANTALGGAGLPSGYSFANLNGLVENLNTAFDT
jgi:hypothetical protein